MSTIYFSDDKEAAEKFLLYKSKDPFPNIYPALLNSADIDDYIRTTGMISPYDSEFIKSASYEILLEGKIYYWDEDNKDCSKEINKGDTFELKKNSIVYVSLKAKFRIPDYIALRFNLKITLVHRGLLLGTGPLVDPGFEGNLLIPLHNLTDMNYTLVGGEGFIWAEFTKLSPNARWANKVDHERKGIYQEFPQSKKNLSAVYYLSQAAPNPIRSSVAAVLRSAQIASEEAKRLIDKIKNYSLMGALVLIIGSFGIDNCTFCFSISGSFINK